VLTILICYNNNAQANVKVALDHARGDLEYRANTSAKKSVTEPVTEDDSQKVDMLRRK